MRQRRHVDAPVLNTRENDGSDGRAAVTLRMFAAARQAAGTASTSMRAITVGEVLEEATLRYGPEFARIARLSQVWLNGEPADNQRILCDGDEVAVLPPVSGGAL